jgi:prolycopene isomerase
MAAGIVERGGRVVYKANVKEIVTERVAGGEGGEEGGGVRATGVRLADGRVFRGRCVVSNATRWDTFGRLVPPEATPPAEHLFRTRFKKAPSFLSVHMGVRADALPPDVDVHHILIDDWDAMEAPRHTLFVSMPSL